MAIEDELSQAIIGILAVRGALNISQITEEVRSARGRASRRIVRERLKRLEEDRVVRRVEGWGHRYEIVG
jgi:DNA-binding HxlR family transcriptional regulator